MDLKTGYKQTDVGVIPEEWAVESFIEIVGSYIDYRGRTPKKLGLSWGGGDILALSANNVQMGRIDTEKEAYLGSTELYQKWMLQGECERGDVLLTMEAPLGNVAQIPDSSRYILSQRVLLIKPKEWMSNNFLAHYMRGDFFQRQLALNATGSTAKGIQRAKLDDLTVYVPKSTAEQEAIAEALSDADAYIDSLDRLLAKKHDIRQGAMQELLTAKRRLPGFSEDWKTRALGTLATLYQPQTISQKAFSTDGFPVYGANGIIGRYRSCNHTTWQITISCRGNCGTVNKTEQRSWITGNAMVVNFDGNEQVSKEFMYHLLGAQDFSVLVTGSGQPQIVKGPLAEFIIGFPPNVLEQVAIATILSDMDIEIMDLRARVNKARDVRKGMMQNLLTGKVRLV